MLLEQDAILTVSRGTCLLPLAGTHPLVPVYGVTHLVSLAEYWLRAAWTISLCFMPSVPLNGVPKKTSPVVDVKTPGHFPWSSRACLSALKLSARSHRLYVLQASTHLQHHKTTKTVGDEDQRTIRKALYAESLVSSRKPAYTLRESRSWTYLSREVELV